MNQNQRRQSPRENRPKDGRILRGSVVNGMAAAVKGRRTLSEIAELAEKSAARVVRTDSMVYRTHTPTMFTVLDQLVRMASHDVSLLLVGETGTGKTTLANLIHELSPRRSEALMTVGCGAISAELIESELFGRLQGSFVGADHDRLGKFEAARLGTLLLDEINALGLEQQAKLLRAIETGEFEPVGSHETRRSTARMIVASNVDLKRRMEQGLFRADLYYRLNVLAFAIPPLRERPLDIAPLTIEFIQSFCAQYGVSIRSVQAGFWEVLQGYHWPGNVRELKNHVRRAVLFCQSDELTREDLAVSQLQQERSAEAPAATLSQKVSNNERRILQDALRANKSNRTATAKSLGISRVGLYKKMKKLGMIEPRS